MLSSKTRILSRPSANNGPKRFFAQPNEEKVAKEKKLASKVLPDRFLTNFRKERGKRSRKRWARFDLRHSISLNELENEKSLKGVDLTLEALKYSTPVPKRIAPEQGTEQHKM